MSTTDEKLVYMANQIARFFAAQGRERAIPAVADHLNKFWGPDMRKDFLRVVQQPDVKLHELVRQAVPLIHPPAES